MVAPPASGADEAVAVLLGVVTECPELGGDGDVDDLADAGNPGERATYVRSNRSLIGLSPLSIPGRPRAIEQSRS